MKLTLIRNATLLIETDGRRILVDPMLRAAGSTPPIENTPNQVPNPLVELPLPADELVQGLDLCLVTHLHSDHFDDAADALLDRGVPILTQPESKDDLEARGFTSVATQRDGFTMTRGHHGTGRIGEAMGAVSGWVFDGLYLAGDTIWCDEVQEALREHRPSTVVVNAGAARFNEGGPIVMDAGDVRRVRAATDATVIVVHLEAVNHCLEGRAVYRAVDGIVVPDDGETLTL